MLLALFGAPHYFRRLGRGNFRKAPEETVKAALLGIERKKLQAAQIDAWADEIAAGACPAPIREQLYKILFRPDKNAPEYKAVVEAARRAQRAPLDLLTAAGAIDSPYQFHWRRFLFENFPKGTALPAAAGAGHQGDAAARAMPGVLDRRFGDDRDRRRALGAGPGHGNRRLRHPHRRAGPGVRPRLAARQGGARAAVHRLHAGLQADHAARRGGRGLHADRGQRLPGGVALRHASTRPRSRSKDAETRLERVPIVANLRHDQLDAVITEAVADWARRRPTTPSRANWRSPSAWRAT